MAPYWQFLVTVGAWAQEHPTLVMAIAVLIVFVLGGVKITQHSTFWTRRPRL